MASTDSAPITIGYWNIKGLAAPLRAMTMYAGKEFQNAAYVVVDKPEGGQDYSAWFAAKPALKEQNPLMNLPYVIDHEAGGVVVAQSNACMAYLGRKLGLWGKNDAEVIACEQLLCEVMDLRNAMVRHVYGPTGGDATAGKALVENVTGPNGILQKLELWLGSKASGFSEAAPFLVGGHATAPDFHLWEMLDQYNKLAEFFSVPPLLAKFPKLASFHKGFAALPANKRYMESPLHQKLPCNNKGAGFGSTTSGHAYSAQPEAIPDTNGKY